MPENPEPGHEHDVPPFRERNIAELYTADGSEIRVDHLYVATADLEPCPDCGGEVVSAGLVGLVVDGSPAVLSSEEALLLANRLTRAADVALEAMEDPPDMDREAARLAIPRSGPDQP